MTDKSSWHGLGTLIGGWGKTSARPLATATRRCEAGHPMAMDWKECPYCNAARTAGERTRIDETQEVDRTGARLYTEAPRNEPGRTRINAAGDSPAEPAWEDPGERSPRGERHATRILPDEGVEEDFGDPTPRDPNRAGVEPGGRGRTRVLDVESSGVGQAQTQRRQGAGRRLTGIVVTYNWSPLGQLFEVHEGRNFGGSGTVAAEGNRDCDICVTQDSTMSSSHFLILCQGGHYRVSDCNSTNGTYVNGELVDALGIELVDNAQIQAGATLMVFKKILPPSPRGVTRGSDELA